MLLHLAALAAAVAEHLSSANVRDAALCVQRETKEDEDLELLPLLLRAATGRPGIFVEVGAHFEGTQTWLLEKCFNWTGLLIDAHPRNFEKLLSSSRTARKVNAAVCHPGRNVTMPDWHSTSGRLHDLPTPVGSGVVSTLEYTTASYRKTWGHLVNSTHLFHQPCRGLSEILAEAGIGEVDFISIDVQGAEEAVLATADLGTALGGGGPTMFKVVLVEAEATAMEKNVRVRKMLEDAGMKKLMHTLRKPFHASYNELYVRPQLVAQDDPRISQMNASVYTSGRLESFAQSLQLALDHKRRVSKFLNGVLNAPDVWTRHGVRSLR